MAKTYLTKADLLAGITLKPQDFEVDGLGWVQVRGLSMNEIGELRAQAGGDDVRLMTLFAHRGLTNPQFGLDEVETLAQANAGFVTTIGAHVVELSGLGDKKQLDPLAGTIS